MKKSMALLWLAPMILLAALSQPPQGSEALYRMALGMIGNGQYFEAQGLFRQALKKEPFSIYCRRGLDLIRDLDNGLVPSDAVRAIAAGLEAELDYHWQEAVDEYRKALDMAPRYYFLLHNLGTSLYNLGQSDRAIAMLEKALQRREDYPYTHNNLGLALNRMRRFKEALPRFQRAIALFPQYHKAYNNMGVAYMGLGMEKEGEAMFQKALEVNKSYTLAYQNMDYPQNQKERAVSGEPADGAGAAAPTVTTRHLLEVIEKGPVMEKKKAQEELSLRNDPEAIGALLHLLGSPSPIVKSAAIEVLGDMRAGEAVLPLAKLATDPDWTVRFKAVWALGAINDSSSLPVVLRALEDVDYHVRVVAVCAAAKAKGPEAMEPLLRMLEDPIAEVRNACLSCLPYMVEVIPREVAIGLLRHGRSLDRTLGVRLVREGKLQMETTEETTTLYVADQKWKKLEEMGIDGASALRAALDFQDPETRIQAVNALGRMAGRDSLNHLYYALKDKDPKVRDAACQGLRRATGQNFQTAEQWLQYFQNKNETM